MTAAASCAGTIGIVCPSKCALYAMGLISGQVQFVSWDEGDEDDTGLIQ